MRLRECLTCLVLQRGEPDVLAWIPEIQGDLDRPGEQVVPLRSCHSGRDSTRTSAKPAEPSVSAQPMRMRLGSRESTGLRACQLVSTRQRPRSPLRSGWRRATGPATAQDRHVRSPGRPASSQARGRARRPREPSRATDTKEYGSISGGRSGLASARPAGGPETRRRSGTHVPDSLPCKGSRRNRPCRAAGSCQHSRDQASTREAGQSSSLPG